MSTRTLRRTTFLAVAANILFAPLAIAAESPRCAALAVSALAEPEWYAEECLGVVRPEAPAAAPGPWLVPGDPFYLHNIRAAGQFPQSLYTAPIPTYTFTLIGPNIRPIFAMDFDNTATTLHAIANGSTLPPVSAREYGTYDLTTGAFVAAGVPTGIPAGETISGLKFDPTSTTVYVNSTINLYTYNVTTGVATLVGPFTHAPAAVIDIAISNTGQMYGEDLNDNFYSIDKTTGATTLIGPTGVAINFAQGMDFDNSDNTLYQFAYIGGGVNDLRRINITTGVSTLILNGALGAEHEGSVRVPATPAVTVAPAALAVDTAGNGVLEPNEASVVVAPSWQNTGLGAIASLDGTLTNFVGPVGATYNLSDATASYGAVAAGATASCTATGNCYQVTVDAVTRPVVHWDSTISEIVNPSASTKDWTLHIGGSFTDVPSSNGFYRFIETILHHNVTSGCAATTYCPGASTTREAMAVFVLVASDPTGAPPPLCVAGSERFTDVPATSGFCRWIEELERRAVVSGCTATTYCPTAPATREQMAVFVLRTLDPTLNPPACVAGSETFADVPSTNGFCRWIEELERRGVVTGCGGANYCPTADVTREQMSVFLGATFSLTLYGL